MAAATAACIASLGFAACGGDDDESSSDETTGATGATGAQGSFDVTDAEAFLREDAEAQGLSEEDTDCVVDAVTSSVPEDELVAGLKEAEENGFSELNDQIQEASADAAEECGLTLAE
jgi:hypothetical protein